VRGGRVYGVFVVDLIDPCPHSGLTNREFMVILTKSEEERRSRVAARLANERTKERKERRRRSKQRRDERRPGTRAWLMQQPERWRGRLFYHYKRDPGGDIDGAWLDHLLEIQQGRCAYCELPMGDDLVLEHVTPHSAGGRFTRENIVLACNDCNARKLARPVDRFLASLPSLRERI
jgi:5-methylcytosine-specific restriction endonuclease McrA